jgi:hypothetical protein
MEHSFDRRRHGSGHCDRLLIAREERIPELLADKVNVRAVDLVADALFFDGFEHVYHPG